jgi:hypothetical protein
LAHSSGRTCLPPPGSRYLDGIGDARVTLKIGVVLESSESLVGGQLKLGELYLIKGPHASLERGFWHRSHLERESDRIFRKTFLRRSLDNRRSCEVGAIQVCGQWYHEH